MRHFATGLLMSAALSLLATTALAQGANDGGPPGLNRGGGDANVTNENTNTNVNYNANSAAASSASSSEATGVGVGVGYGGNAEQGQYQGQEQGQFQGQGQYQGNYGSNEAVGSGNSTDVTVEGDNNDYEAPAFAPALSGLTGTECMGSTSASGGWVGGALGFGTTWTEEHCQRLQAMRLIGSMPEGFSVDGVSQQAILAEMAKGLVGVQAAVNAAKGEQTVSRNEALQQQAKAGGSPAYCHEDSWASEDVILDNCPNGEALVSSGAGSLF